MSLDRNPPGAWRIIMFAGLADIGLGLLLVALSLLGYIPSEDPAILAGVGAVFAAIGAGIFIWARNKAEDRRGDLN